MSNLIYKNPISPLQVLGSSSVSRTDTFGTNFSVLGTGGYMEVYNLSDLNFTIPVGQTGTIEFTGNTIPIQFKKGTGSAFSPDVLTLNSDNISTGRRRLGMLVYVYETKTIYQHTIDNYDSLWSAATVASGPGGTTVVISDFGTTVKNNTIAGQNFINAWTASTIEGVSGFTNLNSTWRILQTGGGSGSTVSGDYLPLSGGTVTGETIFQSGLTANTISATTYQNLPVTADTYVTGFTFNPSNYNLSIEQNNGISPLTQNLSILASDLTVTGGTYDPNTGVATFTNNTGGTFQVSGFTSGLTDTVITNFTYTPSTNTFTITDSRSSAFTATIQSMTGLSVTTISATTYQNLPTYVSAVTESNNIFTVTTNSGSSTLTVDAVTGGSYSLGTITLSGTGNVNGNTITGLGALSSTTLYTGNGSLLGNRIVDIDGFSLNFSGLGATNNLVLSGGNVGINTSTPSVKLDISGNDTTKNTAQFGTMGIQSFAVNNAWFGDNVFFNGTNFIRRSSGFAGLFYFQGSEGQFRWGSNAASGTPITNGASGFGLISLKTGVDGTFAVGNLPFATGSYTGARMIVNSSGNVGINNIAPAYRLDVTGDGNFNLGTSGFIRMSDGTNRKSLLQAPFGNLMINNNIIYSGVDGFMRYIDNGPTSRVQFEPTFGNILFLGGPSGTANTVVSEVYTLFIGNDGKIGIGTISPTTRLNVSAATDPVRFEGVQTSTDTEILSIDGSGVVHKISKTLVGPFLRNQTNSGSTDTIFVNQSIFNPSNLTVLSGTTFVIDASADYYVLGDLFNSGSTIVNGTLKVGGVIYNNGTITGTGIIE